MKKFKCFCSSQKGAALAVSLIMLLVLTLIGITGMHTTTLEEKMSGNGRDYNLAFQAAEVALRTAEAYVESLVTVTDFVSTNSNDGRLAETETDPDYFSSDTWYSTNGSTVGSVQPSYLVSSLYGDQPRYIVKYVTEYDPDTNARLNIGGYGEKLAGAQVTVFRVTARGTGGTNDSQVLLQSHYGKRF
ncbi:MAG: PilX N-terminal domain-containing pilus assembly protein [Methylococcaceae bacterium]|nr:PilX N-terminal domain-containing pilus assembly protein [Methylococcaceae bacterium]